MHPIAILAALIAFVAAACAPTDHAASDSASVTQPIPAIAEPPVLVTVKQRSTTPIPGASGELSLSVGDITRGQVMVTLIGRSSAALLGPLSLKQGDTAEFQLGSSRYSLKLARLHNAIIGDDFASFVISEPSAASLTEPQKINYLIKSIETMTGAMFIRNGIEYPAADAAKHLRRKREGTKDEVQTAAKFIELVASRSSLSGEEYKIRFTDGRTVSAGDFLRDQLAKLEAVGEPPQATQSPADTEPGATAAPSP